MCYNVCICWTYCTEYTDCYQSEGILTGSLIVVSGSLSCDVILYSYEFKKRIGCWDAELFEMMRKEQHRQLQEHKQSHAKTDNPSVPRKHDENFLWDDHPHQSPPESPISKSTASIPLATPSRPAIPPGFSKVAQQKQNIDPELPLQVGYRILWLISLQWVIILPVSPSGYFLVFSANLQLFLSKRLGWKLVQLHHKESLCTLPTNMLL